jgi:hypothetical protein
MADELWFVDPTAGGNKAKIRLAQRPIDLAGKVVGLIDNTKEQADVILETVAQVLRERYGVKDVIIERKQAFSKPATDELIESMASRVQVAAAAVGG